MLRIAGTGDHARKRGVTGRCGSVIKEKYDVGEWKHPPDRPPPETYPTNEEVTKAVQEQVAGAVELARKYRHVAWYGVFLVAYLVVMYLQASAYKTGEVVATLKKALMPEDGSHKMTFNNEREVLAYLGAKVVLPIWQDPVCGDGNCEGPWEFPAFGRFGCRADCGMEKQTSKIAVTVIGDFTNPPGINQRVLMSNARWNLCLEDPNRRNRGEQDLCWFEEDQGFSQVIETQIHSMKVVDGRWYVRLVGDYAGRVSGKVLNMTGGQPQFVALEDDQGASISWERCKGVPRRRMSEDQQVLRELLAAYTHTNEVGMEQGQRALRDATARVRELYEKTKRKL